MSLVDPLHIGICLDMLRHMRTTMIINDELYRQVKERARAEDRTVTSFVEDALRARLAGRPGGSMGAVDVVLAPAYHGRGGMRPGIDPSSNVSMLDAMDEDLPIDKLR